MVILTQRGGEVLGDEGVEGGPGVLGLGRPLPTTVRCHGVHQAWADRLQEEYEKKI